MDWGCGSVVKHLPWGQFPQSGAGWGNHAKQERGAGVKVTACELFSRTVQEDEVRDSMAAKEEKQQLRCVPRCRQIQMKFLSIS